MPGVDRWEDFKRLLRHRSAALGLVLVTTACFLGLTCQWLVPFPPNEQYRDATGKPPGSAASTSARETRPAARRFAWGTDVSGRDVLSRVLYGARISLLVGIVATVISLFIGVTLGLVAGYFGGWLDLVLMRITDIFFAFPGILLSIILLATLRQEEVKQVLGQNFEPGIWGLFLALGVTGWTSIARVIRGEALALKERDFIEAARAIGCSHGRIIFRHVLPNTAPLIIVLGTMAVAQNILSEAGLSFLGLGVQPPEASWGGMLAEGRPYLTTMPWWGLYPGVALALTVLGFNMLGDGLRDVLDPRLRRSL
jgi:ABC-type dipeptide/oligopeptide/nickel transport system permease subunit